MKILFVALRSIHFLRWVQNLEAAGFELYWFDISQKGPIEALPYMHQTSQWKKRKLPYIKGEYMLSKKLPKTFSLIQPFLEVTVEQAFENLLKTIKPDIVHSFEMHSCSSPILKVMKKNIEIKWVYSCWGNDLYYYKNYKNYLNKIKKVLKRIDYLHTDNHRDYNIAKQLNFRGKYLGVIPGGGGYKLELMRKKKTPIQSRRIILVKGYEHYVGKGLNIVKALHKITETINNYDVIVISAHEPVIRYIKENKLSFKYYNRVDIQHDALIELMGRALLYIGNSVSDGMPNTLLEAVILGAFPIQSNPGGASAEIINHGENGLLISNPEDVNEIKSLIENALENKQMLIHAEIINTKISNKLLGYSFNQKKIIACYDNN